jgi:hypothetical protein
MVGANVPARMESTGVEGEIHNGKSCARIKATLEADARYR